MVLGSLLTLLLWFQVRRVEQDRLRSLQITQTSEMVLRLQGELNALEKVLLGAAKYAGQGPLPTRNDWHDYVEELHLDATYPGLQGFAFVEWIPRAGLDAHVQRIRKEGFPDYTVIPGGTLPPDSEGYSSIIYHEPMDARNQRAIAHDMLQELTRRTAMVRARDTGLVTLTAPITLYQETNTEVQAGTLMLVPIYRRGLPRATVLQRRQALRGWSAFVFRMGDFTRASLGRDLADMDLELSDGDGSAPSQRLFASNSNGPEPRSTDRIVQAFEVAGRTWTIRTLPTDRFLMTTGFRTHWEILLGGLGMSLFVFTLLITFQGAEARAKRLADERGEDLLATEFKFRALFEKAPLGMAIVDSDSGRLRSVNARMGQIFGHSPEDLMKRDFQSITHADHLDSDLYSVRQIAEGITAEVHKEKRYLHRDGHIVWGRLSMVKLPTSEGEPHQHLAIVEDITEERRRDEEIRVSEERFRAIFNLSPDPITLSRLSDGALVMANPAWYTLTGVLPEAAVGRAATPPNTWTRPGEREALLAELKQRGQITPRESTLRHVDGAEHQILLTAQVIKFWNDDLVLILGKNVTQRHQAEEALRASEARFRSLFEKNLAVSLILDPEDGRIVRANAAAAAFYGWSEEELLQKKIQDINTLTLEKIQVEMARARNEQKRSFEFTHCLASGEQRQVEVFSSPIEWDGRILLVSFVHDITSRVEADSKLRHALAEAQRFREALEQVPACVFIKDAQSRYVYANQEARRLMGCSAAELVGSEDARFFPVETVAHLKAIDARVLQGEETQEEVVIPGGQGAAKVFWEIKTPVYAEDDPTAVWGLLGISTDVTERKRAEEALRASETRWQYALDGAGDGVWDWQEGSDYLVLSRGYRAMLGYAEDDGFTLSFQDWMERIHSEDRESVQAVVNAYLEGAPTYQSEYRFRCKDGHHIWILARGKAVTRDGAGRPTRIIGTHTDISERKQAELALLESEARFRSVVSGSPVAIFLHAEGRFTFLNPAALSLFRATRPEDLLGKPVLDRVHPDDQDLVRRRIAQGYSDGYPNSLLEQRLIALDGATMEAEVQSCPVAYAGQTNLLVFAQDISGRKRALAELTQSEADLARAQEIGHFGSWRVVYSEAGEQWSISGGLRLIYGYEADLPVTMETGLERVPPEDRGSVQAAWQACLDGSGPCEWEHRILVAGQIKWLSVRVQHQHTEDGRLRESSGTVQDISERKVAEDLLRSSEARFRHVVEIAGDAIFLNDTEGQILLCNRAACTSTGYSMEELLSLRIGELDAEFNDSHNKEIIRALKPGELASIQARHRRKDGSTFPVEVRISLYLEEPRLVLALVRDLTGHEHATQAELKARKAESLVLMAGGIAHDFNNLFQAIQGNLDLAGMQAEGNARFTASLNRAKGALNRAVSLSWKMLDFSGHGFIQLEDLNLEQWLPAYLAVLQLELPPGLMLDAALQPVPHIKGDRSKLEQLLKALVDNAVEAIGPEGGQLRLRLHVDFGEDRPRSGESGIWPLERPEIPATVCLELADDGPGVPPEKLNLICDPFYTTREPGRGLGLPAVVGILRAHAAGLHIFNGDGKGLSLKIHFPPSGA